MRRWKDLDERSFHTEPSHHRCVCPLVLEKIGSDIRPSQGLCYLACYTIQATAVKPYIGSSLITRSFLHLLPSAASMKVLQFCNFVISYFCDFRFFGAAELPFVTACSVLVVCTNVQTISMMRWNCSDSRCCFSVIVYYRVSKSYQVPVHSRAEAASGSSSSQQQQQQQQQHLLCFVCL